MTLLIVGACSSFSAEDSPAAGGEDAARDGTASDAALVFDAGPDALLAEDFEVDYLGCNDWTAKAANVTWVKGPGRTGTGACKVCPTLTDPSYAGIRKMVDPAAPAGTYAIEAYVRYESGEGATLVAGAFDVNGNFRSGSGVSIAQWTQVTSLVTVDGGVALAALLSSQSPKLPTCYLVDDIVVRKIK
jgi:hypothetical protein